MKTLFALNLALVAIVVNGAGDQHHDHDHAGHKCACEAIEFDYVIDCSDIVAMTEALGRLQSGGCALDCTSGTCDRDWLIVQTHHDHCPEANIPLTIETDFHDYDQVCSSCDIVRQEIPGAPQCPLVNCTDGSGTAAYQRLLANGCNIDCAQSSTTCRDDWLTLRVIHDTCDHSALTQAAEEGMHALEEPCAAYQCNPSLDVIANTLECTEDLMTDSDTNNAHDDHDDHDHDNHHGGETSVGGADDSGSFKVAAGSIIAMAIAITTIL
ncbi:unnamed protein product [Cylindrotheca closterium]|uniref:Uncharacterized protein n=1 Tax=Cylindrotheca closterium TaxID=2856 RepID=A0AAD2CHB9_9STRA|nr:unnamed protein product [Cylindrotheca closterium]